MEDAQLRQLLQEATTVAVYGMSRDPRKAAHRIPAYLIDLGFDVIPVNPFADEILARRAYENLMDVPGRIDIVNVFRPSAQAGDVVAEAVRRKEARGDVSLIWLQLGIINEAAQELAKSADIPFVQDRCLAVEIPRLFPRGLQKDHADA